MPSEPASTAASDGKRSSRPSLAVAALLAVVGTAFLGYGYIQAGARARERMTVSGGREEVLQATRSPTRVPWFQHRRRAQAETESTEAGGEEEEEASKDPAYVAGILGVAATFVLGHFAEHHHINWLPEAAIALLLGILVASGAWMIGAPWLIHMKFDFEFFMTILVRDAERAHGPTRPRMTTNRVSPCPLHPRARTCAAAAHHLRGRVQHEDPRVC